ncbi:sodium/hydrogen exchanger family-like protein [Aureococcus anophagefferens]|nr:sodium/hydrogen exchanger family-like protein [Aureococcus anophagefferens]
MKSDVASDAELSDDSAPAQRSGASYRPRRRKIIPFLEKLVQLIQEEPELIQWTKEGAPPRRYLRPQESDPSSPGNIIIPDPKELEKKLPTYFRHEHYSSFQRQLNNFGYNKLHKSSSPQNSVYVRIKGDQLTDMDPVELLQLRPVLERSTLRRAKRTRRKGDKKAKKAAKKDARRRPRVADEPAHAADGRGRVRSSPSAPARRRGRSSSPTSGPTPPVALLPRFGGGAAPPGSARRARAPRRGGGFAEAFAEGHYAHLPGIAFHLARAAVAAAPRRCAGRRRRWAPTPGASSFSVFQRKAPPAGAAGVLCPGLYASPSGLRPSPSSPRAAPPRPVAAAAADARDGGDGAPAPGLARAGGGRGPGRRRRPAAAAFFAAPPPEAPLPSRPHSPDGHWRANLEDDDVHIFPDDFSDILPPEEPFLL